ncbi:MAG: Asp-tRNA(Asn)/Glu-tRNA(Gln) amidotransferase subunit GatB [Nitrososphaerota archaeon]|nr:Asp-tRNA(Asn)/Glu-tRNA(Gln) amidotransferase subunit GatB [Nitrososphaerota archaeon]MDG7052025.1 Asp-tRNA(Asn)/Glu-tRNA(Gln) amidotransferase subunit GatB [Nitrososphaerota archaeon]
MSDYMIGLEVHVQMVSLKSKLFCACPTDYRGKPPNTNICPICTGLPGALPVLNIKAVEEGLKIALALHAEPSTASYFFRKSYFYPDLPKNFQITQYDKAGGVPLAHDGHYTLKNGKTIRIERIHMEEDPGRIYYEGGRGESRFSLVDYNRSGIALVEIVTSPDFTEPEEAREFLELLQKNLDEIGINVSEYEGSVRCDANISYAGGERVEVKNISGATEVEKALRYESVRQRNMATRGVKVRRETRSWDERRRITISSRSKEVEAEYRYMPEEDLPPVSLNQTIIKNIALNMRGSFEDRYRVCSKYGVGEEAAKRLAGDPALYTLFMSITGANEMDASRVGNVLANEFAFVVKKHNNPSLSGDTSSLENIIRAYIRNGDRSRFISAAHSWVSGIPVRAEEYKPKVDIDTLIDETLEKEMKNIGNLEGKRRLDYLMGQILKVSSQLNRKELYIKLQKKLEGLG